MIIYTIRHCLNTNSYTILLQVHDGNEDSKSMWQILESSSLHKSAFRPKMGRSQYVLKGYLAGLFHLFQTNINKHKYNVIDLLTSSGVSLVSGWAWAARRAMAPARILLRLIWRSGGGPPRGWPRTMMAQPDKTCKINNKSIGHCFIQIMASCCQNTLFLLLKIYHKRELAVHRTQTPGTNGQPLDSSHLGRMKQLLVAFRFFPLRQYMCSGKFSSIVFAF